MENTNFINKRVRHNHTNKEGTVIGLAEFSGWLVVKWDGISNGWPGHCHMISDLTVIS